MRWLGLRTLAAVDDVGGDTLAHDDGHRVRVGPVEEEALVQEVDAPGQKHGEEDLKPVEQRKECHDAKGDHVRGVGRLPPGPAEELAHLVTLPQQAALADQRRREGPELQQRVQRQGHDDEEPEGEENVKVLQDHVVAARQRHNDGHDLHEPPVEEAAEGRGEALARCLPATDRPGLRCRRGPLAILQGLCGRLARAALGCRRARGPRRHGALPGLRVLGPDHQGDEEEHEGPDDVEAQHVHVDAGCELGFEGLAALDVLVAETLPALEDQPHHARRAEAAQEHEAHGPVQPHLALRHQEAQPRPEPDQQGLNAVGHWQGQQTQQRQVGVHDAEDQAYIDLLASNGFQRVLRGHRKEGEAPLNLGVGIAGLQAADQQEDHHHDQQCHRHGGTQEVPPAVAHPAQLAGPLQLQDELPEEHSCEDRGWHEAEEPHGAQRGQEYDRGKPQPPAADAQLLAQVHSPGEAAREPQFHALDVAPRLHELRPLLHPPPCSAAPSKHVGLPREARDGVAGELRHGPEAGRGPPAPARGAQQGRLHGRGREPGRVMCVDGIEDGELTLQVVQRLGHVRARRAPLEQVHEHALSLVEGLVEGRTAVPRDERQPHLWGTPLRNLQGVEDALVALEEPQVPEGQAAC
mmetsp:Transcript_28381/g.81685  ORF Transcript_28381/g.81685 Transcript_28381/m.81685 type:complete len:635 (+) Transcript_28381:1350-3254(+)